MIAFFDDAGFILGAYALTFGTVAVFSWRVVRHGSKLARRVPDEDKYWT